MLPYNLVLLLAIASVLCQQSCTNSTAAQPELRIPVAIPEVIDPTTPFDIDQHLKDYERLLAEIPLLKKQALQNDQPDDQKIIPVEDTFTKILVDSIFPYWYETTWDFNGHTATPRKGDIACGYFVSTTLKHAGVKLNRYKIAQQAASVIVEKLCAASSIRKFSNIEQLSNHLRSAKNHELFIVGLDYHVGFILKRDDKNYFIHSDYIGREGVKKEVLDESRAIQSSNLYVIGSLTKNIELMQNWLH